MRPATLHDLLAHSKAYETSRTPLSPSLRRAVLFSIIAGFTMFAIIWAIDWINLLLQQPFWIIMPHQLNTICRWILARQAPLIIAVVSFLLMLGLLTVLTEGLRNAPIYLHWLALAASLGGAIQTMTIGLLFALILLNVAIWLVLFALAGGLIFGLIITFLGVGRR